MSTKVTVYGLKARTADGWNRMEYASEEARDADYDPTDGWTKYTVTRTVRAKGKPLWWAIRQLQEGRAVVDASGDKWSSLSGLLEYSTALTDCPWAQSWTLAEVQP